LLWLALCAAQANAAVRLSEIFANGMVLQKSAQTPVWGWGEPEAKVHVALGQAVAETKAGPDGKWRVNLDLESVGPGPHEMTVNETKLADVLVGEVWLCGGQSNMEYKLGETLDAGKVISESANPSIRQFLVPRRAENKPVDDVRGQWMQAGPADSGKFTAVGYYFARKLQNELSVPVGIINATWGNSPAETWMSREALATLDGLADAADRVNQNVDTYPARREQFIQAFRSWLTANGNTNVAEWTDAEARALPGEKWSTMKLPQPAPATDEPGAIWFRRTVDVPAGAAGKPLSVTLGNVQMLEEVWWNGERVGRRTLETFDTGRNPCKHQIPAQLVRKGANELLLRIWSPAKTPHFTVWVESFTAGPVSLVGEWQTTRERTNPKPKEAPPQPPLELSPIQHVASRAFNGMIAPLVPYGIAGVIWYQGENNNVRAAQYRDVFPELIKSWRKLWSREDLPFFWCQLANHKKKQPEPVESTWAELQEAQTRTLALPRTGQAVTCDVGEAGDIHPRNKAVPGRRLADIALAEVYGKDTPVSGPVYKGATFGKGKAVVHFADTAGGLVTMPVPATQVIKSIPSEKAPLLRNSPDSQLEGFAICGADRVWKWADACIDGETVVVWNPLVPAPVAVRYAWADNPTFNLYGKNGLPAVPFRTDDFPLTTAGRVYPWRP
jgi:sialate O-acetylesterase